MILSRFLGDRWLERFGPHRVVRFLGVGVGVGVGGGGLWGVLTLCGIWLSSDFPLPGIILVNTGFFFAGIAIGSIFLHLFLVLPNSRALPLRLALQELA
jgi:hypothetical protein